jgi:hypothetical protein
MSGKQPIHRSTKNHFASAVQGFFNSFRNPSNLGDNNLVEGLTIPQGLGETLNSMGVNALVFKTPFHETMSGTASDSSVVEMFLSNGKKVAPYGVDFSQSEDRLVRWATANKLAVVKRDNEYKWISFKPANEIQVQDVSALNSICKRLMPHLAAPTEPGARTRDIIRPRP